MEAKDIRSSVDLIRELSKADLILASLVFLPILLGGWVVLLNSLAALDQHRGWKLVIIGVVLLSYIVGLIIMRSWDPPEDKLRRARSHVRHRLEQRPKHRASFDAIRDEVNPSYTDAFLDALIDKNPGVFRTCRVAGPAGPKRGIALSEDEEAPPNIGLQPTPAAPMTSRRG